MKFKIENARCFGQPSRVRIAPLTMLVGENSTGKSSFMALLHTAHQVFHGKFVPDFNAEPFKLGAYDQIAHCVMGQNPAESFHLSLTAEVSLPTEMALVETKTTDAVFEARFVAKEGQPALQQFRFDVCEFHLAIELKASSESEDEIRIDFPAWQGTRPIASTAKSRILEGFFPWWMMPFAVEQAYGGIVLEANADQFAVEASRFSWIAKEALSQLGTSVYPFAPVRTKPLRTYDPGTGMAQEEGAHVPTRLAQMQSVGSSEASSLQRQINEFGKGAGLFQTLEVKTLGASQADPFQIHARVGDTYANLIDVGYGVSQVLPIIVDLLEGGNESRLYLLQQPEVHLHPRAQAQLGSFLGETASRPPNCVVVETHSDFLVDRVRMAIGDKTSRLTSEDVSLLYFDHTGSEVQIHEIALDSFGDIVDPPASYRAFFMSELRNKFGV